MCNLFRLRRCAARHLIPFGSVTYTECKFPGFLFFLSFFFGFCFQCATLRALSSSLANVNCVCNCDILHRRRRANTLHIFVHRNEQPARTGRCRAVAVKSKETHRTCSLLLKVYFVVRSLIRCNELFLQFSETQRAQHTRLEKNCVKCEKLFEILS